MVTRDTIWLAGRGQALATAVRLTSSSPFFVKSKTDKGHSAPWEMDATFKLLPLALGLTKNIKSLFIILVFAGYFL